MTTPFAPLKIQVAYLNSPTSPPPKKTISHVKKYISMSCTELKSMQLQGLLLLTSEFEVKVQAQSRPFEPESRTKLNSSLIHLVR